MWGANSTFQTVDARCVISSRVDIYINLLPLRERIYVNIEKCFCKLNAFKCERQWQLEIIFALKLRAVEISESSLAVCFSRFLNCLAQRLTEMQWQSVRGLELKAFKKQYCPG
jgi:hypothetical protein